jgi:hypothetical protein
LTHLNRVNTLNGNGFSSNWMNILVYSFSYFIIFQACLVPSTAEGKVSTLFIETENSEEFILSNLSLKNFNATLDISFNEGEKICFRVSEDYLHHVFTVSLNT